MGFLYLGILLISASLVLLEIALVRVFAISLSAEVSVLAVAVPALGLGIAGSILAARRAGLVEAPPDRILALLSGIQAIAGPAFVFMAAQVPLESISTGLALGTLVRLGLVHGLLAVPFLLIGFVVTLAIARHVERASALVSVHWLGMALGACASPLALGLGAVAATAVAGAVAGLAAIAFAANVGARETGAAAASFAIAAALAVLGSSDAGRRIVPFSADHAFAAFEDVKRISGTSAEIEVGPLDQRVPVDHNEVGFAYHETTVDVHPIGRNGAEYGLIQASKASPAVIDLLRSSLAAAPYQTFDSRYAAEVRPRLRALAGGARGGETMLLAEAFQAIPVVVIEPDDAIVTLLNGPSGVAVADAVRATDFHLEAGDLRAYVRSVAERWDVIQLHCCDVFTALDRRAVVGQESRLLTHEGVRDLFDGLSEAGTIQIVLPLDRSDLLTELVDLARIAILANQGRPYEQIAILRGRDRVSLLIKRVRFAQSEIDRVNDLAVDQGFWGFVYDPLIDLAEPLLASRRHLAELRDGYTRASERGILAALEYKRRFAPESIATAFQMRLDGKGDTERVLLARLVGGLPVGLRQEALDAIGELLDPLYESNAEEHAVFLQERETWRTYFRAAPEKAGAAALPTARTDRRPFGVADPGLATAWNRPPLAGWLVWMLVLMGAALFVPLRSLSRADVETPTPWRWGVFFAASGLALGIAEIAAIQPLASLITGRVAASIDILLPLLLGGAAFGAWLAPRLGSPTRAMLLAVSAAIVAALLLQVFGAYQLEEFAPASSVLQIVVASALLLPLGASLGLPLALGLALTSRRCPQLVPWCLGAHAMSAVLGSIACVVVATPLGLDAALALAAVAHLAGAVLVAPLAVANAADSA